MRDAGWWRHAGGCWSKGHHIVARHYEHWPISTDQKYCLWAVLLSNIVTVNKPVRAYPHHLPSSLINCQVSGHINAPLLQITVFSRFVMRGEAWGTVGTRPTTRPPYISLLSLYSWQDSPNLLHYLCNFHNIMAFLARCWHTSYVTLCKYTHAPQNTHSSCMSLQD